MSIQFPMLRLVLTTLSLCGVVGTATQAADTEPVTREVPRAENERPWAFTRPRAIEPPQVDHIAEAAGGTFEGLDRFVLARLHEHGLTWAEEATRETLIRRVYFDLIGLPPTPAEAAAFLQDDAPNAYEKVVARLLDDQRYGERWARLWLDLARYADTAGYEGDPDLPQAWRYRDYVIDAFNNDKPYDQFIKEQLAGDEFTEIMGAGDLPDAKPEHMVALTFLRLAPFTEPRGDKTRHEMLSEMTSTIGSVFLGLTLGCAKCHDHKYDQIPTTDFYRMKAFLATIQIARPEPGDAYQIGGPLPVAFYREGEAEWADQQRKKHREQATSSKRELESFLKELRQRARPRRCGIRPAVDRGRQQLRLRHDGLRGWQAAHVDRERRWSVAVFHGRLRSQPGGQPVGQ